MSRQKIVLQNKGEPKTVVHFKHRKPILQVLTVAESLARKKQKAIKYIKW